jgi:hypothetical protein
MGYCHVSLRWRRGQSTFRSARIGIISKVVRSLPVELCVGVVGALSASRRMEARRGRAGRLHFVNQRVWLHVQTTSPRNLPRGTHVKRLVFAVIVAVMAIGLSGCQCMRAIDQWKCDNLGWCCCGTRPSQPPACAQPYPACPQACPPAIANPCNPCSPAVVDPCQSGATYPICTPVQ